MTLTDSIGLISIALMLALFVVAVFSFISAIVTILRLK